MVLYKILSCYYYLPECNIFETVREEEEEGEGDDKLLREGWMNSDGLKCAKCSKF